jgi:peptidoglycan/xylan/chitin deacetylase (PgdA/CDA1 family)
VQQTIDVLPRIIELIERKGLGFVTVDEMLGSARP